MMPSGRGRRKFPPLAPLLPETHPASPYTRPLTPYAAIQRSCGAGVFLRPTPSRRTLSRVPNALAQRSPKSQPGIRGTGVLRNCGRGSLPSSIFLFSDLPRRSISLVRLPSSAPNSFNLPPSIPTLRARRHGARPLIPNEAQVSRAQKYSLSIFLPHFNSPKPRPTARGCRSYTVGKAP